MDKFLELENVEKFLDYISDGIQMIDLEGCLIYCNKSAADLDEIDISDALGKHICEIYPSLNEENSTLLEVLKTKKPIMEREQTFRTYRGKEVMTINTTLPIIKSGNVVGAIEISRDITHYKKLTDEVVGLKEQVYGQKKVKEIKSDQPQFTFDQIITSSVEFNRVKQIALKAASKDIPVLVYGETGTGKELLIQSIHNASKRKNKNFIAQNCAALPAPLLEGILFGTAKGGFTGAVDRKGLFELAEGGTLFLDEINSMPLELQAKLLRVLQDGIVRRVGDIKTRKVDVRVLAAMNVDPNYAIENNQIRRDLYYRLNTVTLWIPRLRDRKEDILLLTDYFITKYNRKLGKDVLGISSSAKDLFMNYDWDGNVRELEHVIEGAIHFIEGDYIELEDLPPNLKREKLDVEGPNVFENQGLERIYMDETLGLKENLQNVEAMWIKKILDIENQNVAKTAKRLKIPRQTLQYRIKKIQEE